MPTVRVEVPREFWDAIGVLMNDMDRLTRATNIFSVSAPSALSPEIPVPPGGVMHSGDMPGSMNMFAQVVRRVETTLTRSIAQFAYRLGPAARLSVSLMDVGGFVARPMPGLERLLAGSATGRFFIGATAAAAAPILIGTAVFEMVRWLWDKMVGLGDAMLKDYIAASGYGASIGGFRAVNIGFGMLGRDPRLWAGAGAAAGDVTGAESAVQRLLGVGNTSDSSDALVAMIAATAQWTKMQPKGAMLQRADILGLTKRFTAETLLMLRNMSEDEVKRWAGWYTAHREEFQPTEEAREAFITLDRGLDKFLTDFENSFTNKLDETGVIASMTKVSKAFEIFATEFLALPIVGEAINAVTYELGRLANWLNRKAADLSGVPFVPVPPRRPVPLPEVVARPARVIPPPPAVPSRAAAPPPPPPPSPAPPARPALAAPPPTAKPAPRAAPPPAVRPRPAVAAPAVAPAVPRAAPPVALPKAPGAAARIAPPPPVGAPPPRYPFVPTAYPRAPLIGAPSMAAARPGYPRAPLVGARAAVLPRGGYPAAPGAPGYPSAPLVGRVPRSARESAFYEKMLAAYKNSSLVGVVPRDGARYGITTGSAEEWARFSTDIARKESDFNPRCGNTTDPGGSFGVFQYAHGQVPGGNAYDTDASIKAFVRDSEQSVRSGGIGSHSGMLWRRFSTIKNYTGLKVASAPTTPSRQAGLLGTTGDGLAPDRTSSAVSSVPQRFRSDLEAMTLAGGRPQNLHNYMLQHHIDLSEATCGQFMSSVVREHGGVPPRDPAVASNWNNFGGVQGAGYSADPNAINIAVRQGTSIGSSGSHVTSAIPVTDESGHIVGFRGIGANQGKFGVAGVGQYGRDVVSEINLRIGTRPGEYMIRHQIIKPSEDAQEERAVSGDNPLVGDPRMALPHVPNDPREGDRERLGAVAPRAPGLLGTTGFPGALPASAFDRSNLRIPAAIRYADPGAQFPSQRAKELWGETDIGVLHPGGGETGAGSAFKIAGFPDPVHGLASNMDLLSSSSKYRGQTIDKAVSNWSGGYRSGTSTIEALRRAGFDTSEVLSDKQLKDPKFMKAFFGQVQKDEAGKRWMTPAQEQAGFDMYRSGSAAAYYKRIAAATDQPPGQTDDKAKADQDKIARFAPPSSKPQLEGSKDKGDAPKSSKNGEDKKADDEKPPKVDNRSDHDVVEAGELADAA